MPKGLEIEKKYLIAYPNAAELLKRGAVVKKISQTYLATEKGVSERVRSSATGDKTVFTHTVKTKLEGIVRTEDERVISEEEYLSLLSRADNDCSTIMKERYVLHENGFCYEFDLFPFWSDRAFLEVELEKEDTEVRLPDYVTVLADVSLDKNYTNHALSRMLHARFSGK